MHYMRRRFQKGKGLSKQTQVVNDLVGFPMYAMMALTGHLQDKLAHSKKKINIKTKRTTKETKKTTMGRLVRIKRQVPFLQSLVRQAKGKERDALLRAANADQINAVSEMVLNVLTNDQFPVRPDLVARLRPHKKALRELRKKKNLVKRRREILLKQKGGRFWNTLDRVCRCPNI